ncbi:MAG: fibrobacter succinogenes major paralogous domain-containing protein [Planctomycetes bacterium]|jgi:uncharacterized protein (TIGR02145 family)|nr:fibrobacter succinogenes major paralogous domain-containing protein [Planctomycetota bacterium]
MNLRCNKKANIIILTLFIVMGSLLVAIAGANLVLTNLKIINKASRSGVAEQALESGRERLAWEIKNGYIAPSSDQTAIFGDTLESGSSYQIDYNFAKGNFNILGFFKDVSRERCEPNCLNKCNGANNGCGGICDNNCAGTDVCISGVCSACGASTALVYYDGGPFESDGLTRRLVATNNGYYRTVLINGQCWFRDNLNAGELITNINPIDDNTIEKICYDNQEDNCTQYGALYVWPEAMQYATTDSARGICPEGWHIASDNDFKLLEEAQGMDSVCREAYYNNWGECVDHDTWGRGELAEAGIKLKDGGSSNFNALFAGYREGDLSFYNLNSFSYFWTSTSSSSNAWIRALDANTEVWSVYRNSDDEARAYSIRCVKN